MGRARERSDNTQEWVGKEGLSESVALKPEGRKEAGPEDRDNCARL